MVIIVSLVLLCIILDLGITSWLIYYSQFKHWYSLGFVTFLIKMALSRGHLKVYNLKNVERAIRALNDIKSGKNSINKAANNMKIP